MRLIYLPKPSCGWRYSTLDPHSLIRPANIKSTFWNIPNLRQCSQPSEEDLELASCGCARRFFSSCTKETWTSGRCAGAVSPAKAQQRLYQRDFSRLLELLRALLKSSHQTNDTLPCPPNDTYLFPRHGERNAERVAVACFGGCRQRVWKPLERPFEQALTGRQFYIWLPMMRMKIHQHFTY
jgi:hypothetical protein